MLNPDQELKFLVAGRKIWDPTPRTQEPELVQDDMLDLGSTGFCLGSAQGETDQFRSVEKEQANSTFLHIII